MVAGIGFRSTATADDIVAAVQSAASRFGVEPREVAALATMEHKAGQPAIVEAAMKLGLQVTPVAKPDLANVSEDLMTKSQRVHAITGLPSIAEAAALFAAGPGARLLGPRLATDCVTCAIAQSAAQPYADNERKSR